MNILRTLHVHSRNHPKIKITLLKKINVSVQNWACNWRFDSLTNIPQESLEDSSIRESSAYSSNWICQLKYNLVKWYVLLSTYHTFYLNLKPLWKIADYNKNSITFQGSKKMRQWPINYCNYVPNHDIQHHHFCWLQWVVETNQNSKKVINTTKKTLLCNFGD